VPVAFHLIRAKTFASGITLWLQEFDCSDVCVVHRWGDVTWIVLDCGKFEGTLVVATPILDLGVAHSVCGQWMPAFLVG